MTATPTTSSPMGCNGDGCASSDPWPLHNVRHRGVFFRLCTPCVLKLHAGLFCSSCSSILDPTLYPPDAAVIRCFKCPSVSHVACLPDPALAAPFVCPSCTHPTAFSRFPLPSDNGTDKGIGSINEDSTKVLLLAANLAAASMSKAAAAYKVEAERKVKEAAIARKRAREMLEKMFLIAKEEKETEKANGAKCPVLAQMEPEKKVARMGPAIGAVPSGAAPQKKPQNRERDKWMKFHPVNVVPKTAGQKERVGIVPNVHKERPNGEKKTVGVHLRSNNNNSEEEEEEEGKEVPDVANTGSIMAQILGGEEGQFVLVSSGPLQ